MQNHTFQRFAGGLILLGAFALSCMPPVGNQSDRARVLGDRKGIRLRRRGNSK